MLDARVRAVLGRLEAEDADERARGLPGDRRARQVARTTGRFLFALVAPQTDCEVLEIGGSRGYSTIWLAAGVRYLGGRVLSLEHDPAKIDAWRRNIGEAGLADWAELVPGDAYETLPGIDDVFDVCFLDAEKGDYEQLFGLARGKLEPGAVIVADNVLSHEETLGAYSRARQGDPTLESVTVPLDRGLELSVVLSTQSLEYEQRGKEVVR
ncbi:MAG: O-methyltransferase [Gaiellaceae bacterium]